ncbi:MAG: hypothetical protein AAFX78_04530 [Cyanobacteria bacterium J06638_20]
MNSSIPFVRTQEDLSRFHGQQVVAIGRYTALARPTKGVGRKALPKDRAVIQLDDGTRVYLEPLDSPNSQRSSKEIQLFDRKPVRVRGIAYKLMPSKGQSLIAPCIGKVIDIRENE